MIEWFKEKYEILLPVCAVISIIAFAIAGAIVGYSLGGYDSRTVYAFLGFIIGILAGILYCIFTYGLIGIIIEMRDCLREIASGQVKIVKEAKANNSSNGNPAYQFNTDAQPVSSAEKPNVWVCTKCGHTNPAGTFLCENCKS